MDLGFLSGLLGGKTNDSGMISTLLPLLLAGKGQTTEKGGIGSILSTLFKGNARDNEASYPPLFGEVAKGETGAQNNLLDILGRILSKPKNEDIPKQKDKSDYPYELQYNRPLQQK